MSRRDRLLSQTLLLGAALTSGFAAFTPALAQADDEEIVVTGSRIPQPNLETASPVTQVTGEDIQAAGVTRVEDLVNQLPQAFAAQNATVANGATGAATVDLRGLGPERTLVLIDGRRLPYGSPNDAAADINQIPGALVERVEVLTGGASAVYGSDAVAGVVNFIMMDDFEGVRFDAQYGFFQHNNDYDTNGNLRSVIAGRQLTNPSQFRIPDDNVIHGYSKEFTAVMGVSTDDGRGNITAYVGYRNNDAILQANYDYSACSIGAASTTGFTCGGSSTNATGRFTDFGANAVNFNITVDATAPGNTRNFNASLDQYNFGPLNYYQRPDERYTFGAFGRYEINPHAEVFTQLMFTDYETVAQIAPSGYFLGPASIQCDNPLLNTTQRTAIGCTSPTDVINMYVGRRNVEGGPRQDDLSYRTYRTVLGVRGDLIDNWDYEIAAQYSQTNLSRVYRNELSNRKSALALDVVPDPVTGAPVCRSVLNGQDANCVPWNIWSPGGVTGAALDYVSATGVQTGVTAQQIVTASVFGDLSDLGLQSPASERAVQVALGVEYRRDRLQADSDEAFRTNDLAGQGGPTIPLAGSTDVLDVFAEVRVPLAENRPGFHLLELSGAYRYSDYGSGESTNTYSANLEWAPTEDVRFRGGAQRAVRAPNVIELFEAQGLNLFDLDNDPCSVAGAVTPGNLRTRCLATGVPTANLGNATILDSPAGQYNVFEGGNPNLTVETADSYTIGFVLTPRFLEGFNLSVDYFNIEVVDNIGSFGPDNTLSACYDRGDAAACARIQRNANGQLWLGTGQVVDLNINIGSVVTSGVDLNAAYGFDLESLGLGELGSVNLSMAGTYLESLETDPGGGSLVYDCAGFYANQCGIPNPEWRHRVRAEWATPWNFAIGGTWRYYGEVELFTLGGTTGARVDRNFEAEHYFDVFGSLDLKDNASLRFGVNNVLDDDPQLSASVGTTGNGNTYPQTYDALGRFVFVGLTVDF
jgi:outer membrane receptor protein involved in Fe transport